MFPPELEKLIEYAIIDGEITAKEREILIRKAKELEIDLEEFEMVLDAKLFENRQKPNISEHSYSSGQTTIDAEAPSDKESAAIKCPTCKAPMAGFVTSCAYCGSDFSEKKSSDTIQKLFDSLIEAEDDRREDSSNPFSALGRFYADAFSSISGPSKVDRKKIEIISSFPVPTTKADILEFLTLAIPRAKIIGNFFTKNNPENKAHNLLVPIWKNKCEQIILKAKISMKDDQGSLRSIENLAEEIER